MAKEGVGSIKRTPFRRRFAEFLKRKEKPVEKPKVPIEKPTPKVPIPIQPRRRKVVEEKPVKKRFWDFTRRKEKPVEKPKVPIPVQPRRRKVVEEKPAKNRFWDFTRRRKVVEEKEEIEISKPKKPVQIAIPESDLVLKRPQREIHKRFSVVCLITTEHGNKWSLAVESQRRFLDSYDMEHIRQKLLNEYRPKNRDRKYDEKIKTIEQVYYRDLDLGKVWHQ